MNILLKPNVLLGKPPEKVLPPILPVLKAVIQWIKQFNPAKITVADSAGGLTLGSTDKYLKTCGCTTVSEEEGVDCTSFEKSERTVYKVTDPLVLNEFSGSKLIEEADIIINLPKIKTHGQCIMTSSIKNMFGTVFSPAIKRKLMQCFPNSRKI